MLFHVIIISNILEQSNVLLPHMLWNTVSEMVPGSNLCNEVVCRLHVISLEYILYVEVCVIDHYYTDRNLSYFVLSLHDLYHTCTCIELTEVANIINHSD